MLETLTDLDLTATPVPDIEEARDIIGAAIAKLTQFGLAKVGQTVRDEVDRLSAIQRNMRLALLGQKNEN